MKHSWRYYDYLRRWGLLLFLGLALGALAGFGLHIQQGQKALFKATATISVPYQVSLTVVSNEYSDPKKAVEAILTKAKRLAFLRDTKGANVELDVVVNRFSIEGRYPAPFWKQVVVVSVIGGLLALGAGFVWDDARAYLRHRQETTAGNK